jgi:hypothetical protein
MFSGEAPTVRRFVVQILAGLLAFRHLIVQVAMIKRLCAVLLASAGLFIDTRLVLLVVLFLVALGISVVSWPLRPSRPSMVFYYDALPETRPTNPGTTATSHRGMFETTNRVPRPRTGSCRT